MLNKLILAIILVESGGNPRAVSPKNAKGLMQLTDIGALEAERVEGVNCDDLFDPQINKTCGVALFNYYLRVGRGSIRKALILYNSGYYGLRARKLPRETREYLGKVCALANCETFLETSIWGPVWIVQPDPLRRLP